MQYWKPDAKNEFAGDMTPYWDGETFHLFYLLLRDDPAEESGYRLCFLPAEGRVTL